MAADAAHRDRSLQSVMQFIQVSYNVFFAFMLKPSWVIHVDLHMQSTIHKCRVHVHLMHSKSNIEHDASMIVIVLNLATSANILPKCTPSTFKHCSATNLALKHTTTPFASFFVQKSHSNFMALRF